MKGIQELNAEAKKACEEFKKRFPEVEDAEIIKFVKSVILSREAVKTINGNLSEKGKELSSQGIEKVVQECASHVYAS